MARRILRILMLLLLMVVALGWLAAGPAGAQMGVQRIAPKGGNGFESTIVEESGEAWVVYTDPRGYTFEYPASWQVDSAAPEDGTCPVTVLTSWPDWNAEGSYWLNPPPGQRIVEIYSFANPEGLTARDLATRDAQMSGYVVTSSEELALDATLAWEQAWDLTGHTGHSTFLVDGDRALAIHVYPAEERASPEVEQLLSSVSLTAPLTELQPIGTLDGAVTGSGGQDADSQPGMKLPWPADETWYFTGGPHASWTAGVRSGIDFAPGPSHRTVAVAPGEVTFAGYLGGGSGCAVKLRHPNGWNTWYLHLAAWSVEPQEELGQGEDVGTTGGSGGWPIHIHLELLRDDQDHETWHEKEIDDWQVHQDCEGYTGYDPKGPCSDTNYNGYIHHTLTGRQVLPWAPADDYQTVTSTNSRLLERVKVFESSLPVPWYLLFETADDRIAEVYLDGELLFEQPANCAYQGWVEPGSHTLVLYYEIRGEGIPAVKVRSWPFEAPACATPAMDAPGVGSLPIPCVDQATLIADVTYPEGALVAPGQELEKVWRVRNSGTCTWDGYRLEFAGGEPMGVGFPGSVPVTVPGEEVELGVSMRVPSVAGDYAGQWQIVNREGMWVGGGRLGAAWYVAETSPKVALFLDPPSPSNGNEVLITASAGDIEGLRAMRLLIDGQIVAETSAAEIGSTWDTLPYGDGWHTILAQATTWADPGWVHVEEVGASYELLPDRGPANHAPYPPEPIIPDNHYVTGTIPALCVSPTGDPEGDAVTGLQFEVNGPTAWTSEWVTAPYTCATPIALEPGSYDWRARARDVGGIAGGNAGNWSREQDFTLVGGVEITTFEFDVLSPSAEEEIWIYTNGSAETGQTIVQVNEAGDGTVRGEWRTIGQMSGTLDAEFLWNTLDFSDGAHVVRVTIYAGGGTDVEEQVYTLLHRRPGPPLTQSPADDSWTISRTVEFRWETGLRADSYHLVVSDEPNPEDDATPLLEMDFYTETLDYTHAFDADYGDLYWSVRASNDAGTSGEGGNHHFGIDEEPPVSSVALLPAVSASAAFTVTWSGGDARSGLRWYDVQVRDGERGEWVQWRAHTTETTAVFSGLPGHAYYFRARAMDEVGNQAEYPPGDGDTYTLVDAATGPPPPWWDDGYGYKRYLVIGNQGSRAAGSHYPVHLHLDNTTSPSAKEIWSASEVAIKGDDVRIVYQDQVELDRFVQAFSTSTVDIWFPLQVELGAGQWDDSSYQLYYGNATAGAPLADANAVFLPVVDEHTVALWHFQEGEGLMVADSSGRGHDGVFGSPGWTAGGRFGNAGVFDGSESEVIVADHADLNLTAMTVEGWVYVDGSTIDYTHVLDKEMYWVRVRDDGRLEFRVSGDGGERTVTSTRQLEPDTWYHVAGTHDGGSTQRIYVNGTLEGERLDSVPMVNSDAPFRIGWATNGGGAGHFAGRIHHVRVSDVAREEFPDAGLEIDPVVEVGPLVPVPGTGAADLAVQRLDVYPADGALGGGAVVRAVVHNEGDGWTTNGFTTDLHADHEPVGAGDLTGSVGYWAGGPVEAGATLTLTTVLDQGRIGDEQAAPVTPLAEALVTLYTQADSEGVVAEPDEEDNISPGTEACLAAADGYEGDDAFDIATVLEPGQSQAHNLHAVGDEDWFRFEAEGDGIYQIGTVGLGPHSDTVVDLYDGDGSTLLASSDDEGVGLGSRLEWVAPGEGLYYVRVKQWSPVSAGCGTEYTVYLNPPRVYLPLVVQE